MKIQTARGTSLAVSVHLGTSLGYIDQVPKCPKVVHLGLDHVAGDSVSGQERDVGPIELSLIIVPDVLPVS